MSIIGTIKYEMSLLPVKVKLWNSDEMAKANGVSENSGRHRKGR